MQPGIAGASARSQSERVRQRREEAFATSSGSARLLRALLGPSAPEKRMVREEKAWATGAGGEELLATHLANRCPQVPLLHDRRIPGGRANIDHLAFSAGGIHVIDTKRYRGKVAIDRPLFGEAKLRIAGHDRTKLIAGLERQVLAVKAALAEAGESAPVHGCLCFVVPEGLLADSGLPVIRTLQIKGFPLYYPRRLSKRLNGPGPISPVQAAALRDVLAQRLPPAVPR
jgi:Nuclease-related domain